MISSSDNGFNPAGKFTPGQQDAPLAAAAFQPDVGSQPHDFPLISPTWMSFAQTYDILHVQVGQHV
jgi:hypothetical protein